MLEEKLRLSSYMENLLSEGSLVFSREDAQKALGIGRKAFLAAAERQQRCGRLVRPRQGFYAIVPPEYIVWGTPPVYWYIDNLMRHEGNPYYVGLLSAAMFHGATHQAVQIFQVVADKRLSSIKAGSAGIDFCYRKDMDGVAEGVEKRETETGFFRLSSRELTALDLFRYPRSSGGLHHIATVLAELGERLDPLKLADISSVFEKSVIQRLGYLLDYLGYGASAENLHASLFGNLPVSWVELQPWRARKTFFEYKPIERNRRWKVVVRELPDPDWIPI